MVDYYFHDCLPQCFCTHWLMGGSKGLLLPTLQRERPGKGKDQGILSSPHSPHAPNQALGPRGSFLPQRAFPMPRAASWDDLADSNSVLAPVQNLHFYDHIGPLFIPRGHKGPGRESRLPKVPSRPVAKPKGEPKQADSKASSPPPHSVLPCPASRQKSDVQSPGKRQVMTDKAITQSVNVSKS